MQTRVENYAAWRQPAVLSVVGLALFASGLTASEARASGVEEARASVLNDAAEKYYTIDRVRIDEIPVEELEPSLEEMHAPALEALGLKGPGLDMGSQKDELDDINVALDKIINIGQKIWKIVEDNRPVVNVSTTGANALPQGVSGWQSLEGWQAPQRRAWRIVYENLYGWDVVDFTYKVTFTPGGSMNGRGRYLTNVTVQPVDLDVAWGYTFNAKGSVPSVTNAGTTLNPVGAAEVLLEWTVDTALKHSQSSRGFYVRGDGYFQDYDH